MGKCVCQNNADSPSTHRGAKHFDPRCSHSTLQRFTRRGTGSKLPKLRPIPGTRRVVVVRED